MTTKDDQIYIQEVLNGNANAFSFLIERYKNMVFTLALKMLKNREEAEEAAQDTFIKAYKNLKTFKGDSKFSTWLYKIGYRNCLDRLKKISNKYNETEINEITVNKIVATDDVLSSIEKKERSEIIDKCLLELAEEERAVLWMFYYEELSLKEIVEVTSLSEGNVKVKLHRARKNLLLIVQKRVEPELIKHYGRK